MANKSIWDAMTLTLENSIDKKQQTKPASTQSDNYVIKAGREQNKDTVQNYALRLPKDFYKALKIYCDQKGTTVNTIIYKTLRNAFENDKEFNDAFDYVNK